MYLGLKFESAYVRESPQKSANVRLRTVRLRTDADFRGLRVSTKVLKRTIPRQTFADFSGLSRTYADSNFSRTLLTRMRKRGHITQRISRQKREHSHLQSFQQHMGQERKLRLETIQEIESENSDSDWTDMTYSDSVLFIRRRVRVDGRRSSLALAPPDIKCKNKCYMLGWASSTKSEG